MASGVGSIFSAVLCDKFFLEENHSEAFARDDLLGEDFGCRARGWVLVFAGFVGCHFLFSLGPSCKKRKETDKKRWLRKRKEAEPDNGYGSRLLRLYQKGATSVKIARQSQHCRRSKYTFNRRN
jgi:hypothetical protein